MCSEHEFGKVTETRRHEGTVYRRRQCLECKASFITLEIECDRMPERVRQAAVDRVRKLRAERGVKPTPVILNWKPPHAQE